MLEVKLDALPEVSSEVIGSAVAKPGRPVLSKQAKVLALRGTLETAVTRSWCLGSAPGQHRNLIYHLPAAAILTS